MKELEVIRILTNKGVDYRLIKLSDKGVSFQDVLEFAEDEVCEEEICKTIIVKDKKGSRFAFFLKGHERLDFAKVREVLGKKVSIVSYDDLLKSTGVEPGAVCPFLLDMPLFVDRNVFELEKVNFGSGDHLYGIEIAVKDFAKVVDFEIVDIV